MSRFVFCAVSLAFLVALGCRSELPYTDHSRDPEAYALEVKRLVLNIVAETRRSNEPADSLAPLVLELEQYKQRPSGQHESTYAELLSTAQAALAEAEGATQVTPALNQRLDELEKTAESLPGTVTVVPPPVDS